MTTEATGNKHTVVEQYAVYYVITMTDHSNSRCCNPRFIHSSHNLHIKQQRLQFMQCTSSHGKHASVFRPSKLIYMHIYITTECANTVHCWQRRMYATSLTQYASIINITVQHSWSNTQVSTSFHSFYWKRHRFHTYQQKLIITRSLKISHKNLCRFQ